MSGTRAARPRHIQVGRRGRKRLPRNPRIEESIVSAVLGTSLLYGESAYEKAANTAVELHGRTAAALMRQTDNPTMVIPIWLQGEGGAEDPGCMITFHNHAIVGWTQGVLRLTYFAHLIPYDTVSSATAISVDTIRVDAEHTWLLRIQRVFRSQELLQILLNGFNGLEVAVSTGEATG